MKKPIQTQTTCMMENSWTTLTIGVGYDHTEGITLHLNSFADSCCDNFVAHNQDTIWLLEAEMVKLVQMAQDHLNEKTPLPETVVLSIVQVRPDYDEGGHPCLTFVTETKKPPEGKMFDPYMCYADSFLDLLKGLNLL